MSRAAVLMPRGRSPAAGFDLIFTPEQIAAVLGAPLDNVRTQWPLVAAALNSYGIFNRAVAIAAIATVGVEAGNFWPIEEYRNADGSIPHYWHGYDGGWKHHGYGLIQLTHLYNHVAVADAIRERFGVDLDLANHPELLLEPRWSAFAFAWYFATHAGGAIVPRAQAGAWEAVRKLVNGGLNGYDEFRGYVRALKAIG